MAEADCGNLERLRAILIAYFLETELQIISV